MTLNLVRKEMMNKLLLYNFIRDKIITILLFFFNGVFLFLFYFWTSGTHVEILYPMGITICLFVIYITVEWVRYYRFNVNVQKSKKSIFYDLEPITLEQREIAEALNSIYENYMKQINEILAEQKMQNRFFMQWVHNLKTPISVVKLILDGIKKDDLNEKDLIALKKENNRISEGLQNGLTLLRLEDFSKDYMPHAIDLVKSINNVIKSRKNQFIYNNILPEILIEDKDIIVLSDEKWNEFILEQLVSNGIKYSSLKENSKKLKFIVEQEDEFVILKIIDDGIGIHSSDINRVFEPFFTGENGRKCRESSGIGLYICDIASKKLGHVITINSRFGEGTEVSIKYLTRNS